MKYLVIVFMSVFFAVNAFSSTFYMSNRIGSVVLKVDTQTEDVSVFTEDGLLDHAIGLEFNNDNSFLYVSSGSNGKNTQV